VKTKALLSIKENREGMINSDDSYYLFTPI